MQTLITQTDTFTVDTTYTTEGSRVLRKSNNTVFFGWTAKSVVAIAADDVIASLPSGYLPGYSYPVTGIDLYDNTPIKMTITTNGKFKVETAIPNNHWFSISSTFVISI